MEHLLTACSCGLDPAAEGMALQMGMALALSAPLWFREQIATAVRRLRRKGETPESDPCGDLPQDDPPSG